MTSSADVFPFQAQTTTASQPTGIVPPGGAGSTYLATDTFGGDDSMGGALLTPIPWLTNASFESEDAGLLQDGMLFSPLFTLSPGYFFDISGFADHEYHVHGDGRSNNCAAP